jgi:DeoR/GlpR family transcriptional regulator of sugar metabolism
MAAMLTAERRRLILDTLARDRKVVSADLGASLDVSVDTIRRDLDELARDGLLLRVHGGALPPRPGWQTHAERSRDRPTEKAAIARVAAGMVRDGQVIVLDGGTTTLQVAQQLAPDLRATVATNSPAIAVALGEHRSLEVVLLGGRLLPGDLVAVGPTTVDALRAIRADVCILGVCSLHPDLGIGVHDYDEAPVKRAMIEGAAQVIAVAAADKLDTVAPFHVAPIAELTHLVTEHDVPDVVLARYRDHGIEVLLG